MKRTYLEEDLGLIQKYFPGSKAVALRTPFDLTQRPTPLDRTTIDGFQNAKTGHRPWQGGVLWMS
ncbi:MAG TPA: hypothetical protein VLG92_05705 [Candidatus Saccharimonadia bacterium]|nr:hypothetical protein [Candidatus Saccharimonadia bacterium]